MALSQTEIRGNARLISLIRLLLLAVASAVLTFFLGGDESTQGVWHRALGATQWLLGGVAAASLVLVVTVPLVRRTWQLVLHLVFDLLWLGGVVFLSGGVGGPAVPLLFAVILTSNLVLPGAAPFVVPALASLVLATVATLYLGGNAPLDLEVVADGHPLLQPSRTLGTLAVQVGALFAVDILGQSLSRRLTEQRVLLEDLIEQLGEGVISIDRREQVLYANEGAIELLGLPDLLQPGDDLVALLRGQELVTIAELVLRSQLPVVERVNLKNGRVITVRVGYLRGRGGRIIGRTVLLADETRLHELEADSARAEGLAAMGRMAAGIAHEVRNPLASLRGCAQELGSIAASSGQEDASSLAGIVVSEADRLERIVGEFLSLARERPPQQAVVSVAPVAQEVIEMVNRRSDLPAGLSLSTTLSAVLAPAWVDPDQFRQVLINLVANAVESFTKDAVAPRVTISGGLVDNHVEVAVTDNGVGIAPDRMTQIFTPFHSSKSQGTGLGLTLVDRIVREHGGRIRVESQVGQGTTVSVRLPMAQPHHQVG